MSGQTIFTLILPDSDETEQQASILAKYESADSKQNLAHLMPFTFNSIEDISHAIQAAQTQLEALKANPPQVVAPEPETKPSKTTNNKPSKPKKKKVSLNDIPEDDDFDEEEIVNNSNIVEEIDNLSAESIKVGQVIQLGDNALDVDDEPLEFTKGRVVEVDWDADTPRVWLESLDGEQDAWLPLDALLAKSTPSNASQSDTKARKETPQHHEQQPSLFGAF